MNELTKLENKEIQAQQEINPLSLIQTALLNGIDATTMEKLYLIHEKHERSMSKKAFNKSFSEFKGECKVVNKSVNVKFKTKMGVTDYWHASREDIENATKEALKNAGLAYRFEQNFDKNIVTVTCILSHNDGHCEKSTLQSPPDTSGGKSQIQGIGSTSAYLERYTLSGVLSISQAKVDDDGMSDDQPNQNNQNQVQNQGPKVYTQEKFEKSIIGWAAKILAKEKTPAGIIAFLKTKNTILTDEQTKQLSSITEGMK